MKRKKRKPSTVCYLLIYRDKDLKVVKYEDHFKDYDSAMNRRIETEDSWDGEVVLCTGSSKEHILNAYPEYRMKTESSSS